MASSNGRRRQLSQPGDHSGFIYLFFLFHVLDVMLQGDGAEVRAVVEARPRKAMI